MKSRFSIAARGLRNYRKEFGRSSGDRTDYAVFETTMRAKESFDVVIDMICYKTGDAESLSRAFAGRVGHLIVCSTIDVYAKPASAYPITEQEPHRPPPWDYAQDKASLEGILEAAHRRGDFPVTIIRPGAHLPRQRRSSAQLRGRDDLPRPTAQRQADRRPRRRKFALGLLPCRGCGAIVCRSGRKPSDLRQLLSRHRGGVDALEPDS